MLAPDSFLKQYAFLKGRRGRLRLAADAAPILFILLVAYPLPATGEPMQVALATGLVIICTALLAVVSVPRLHDMGRSGWYSLLLLVPGLNALVLLALLLWPGMPGHVPYTAGWVGLERPVQPAHRQVESVA